MSNTIPTPTKQISDFERILETLSNQLEYYRTNIDNI